MRSNVCSANKAAAAAGDSHDMDGDHDHDDSDNAKGQKFQKVENDENRFFAITSSKLFKN